MVFIFENIVLAILCLLGLIVGLVLVFTAACVVVEGAKAIKKEVRKHDRTD